MMKNKKNTPTGCKKIYGDSLTIIVISAGKSRNRPIVRISIPTSPLINKHG